MPLNEWRPGAKPPAPVYVDASILASSFVARDKRYKAATLLFADLLVGGSQIVISPLTVSESTWALARLSYCDLFNHPSNAPFNPGIFERHCAAIFAKYGGRMNAAFEWIRDWRAAGVDVILYPPDLDVLQDVSRKVPIYMEAFAMASSDAMHLATAEMGARSLITGDTGFQRAGASSVEIFLVPASVT